MEGQKQAQEDEREIDESGHFAQKHRNTQTLTCTYSYKVSAKEYCMEVRGETKGVLTLRL